MAYQRSLHIEGGEDLEPIFRSIMAGLGRPHDDITTQRHDATSACQLRLGIVRLRLCRWYDALMKHILTHADDAKQTEVVSTHWNRFHGELKYIEGQVLNLTAASKSHDTSDANGPQTTNKGASSNLDLITDVLAELSDKRWRPATKPGMAGLPSIPEEQLKRFEHSVSGSIEDPLEATFLHPSLNTMRQSDANIIKDDPAISEQSLIDLRKMAKRADEKFSNLLFSRTGHQYLALHLNGKIHAGNAYGKGEDDGRRAHSYDHLEVGPTALVHLGDNHGSPSLMRTFFHSADPVDRGGHTESTPPRPSSSASSRSKSPCPPPSS